jgi:hypothetical protein
MESLTDGKGAAFLSDTLPPLIALASIRQGLTTTWAVLRRDISRLRDTPAYADARAVMAWVGLLRGHEVRDMNRWVDLLAANSQGHSVRDGLSADSPVEHARAVLDSFRPGLSPFALHSIDRWGTRLSSAQNLAAWMAGMHRQASVTVLRMRLLRNGAVHSGVMDISGAHQLRNAASDVLDAVHEIIPLWTAGRPDEQTAGAFIALRERHDKLAGEWREATGTPRIDAQRLTLPVGNGLDRRAGA